MKTLPLSARQTEPAEGSRKRKVSRSMLEMLFLATLDRPSLSLGYNFSGFRDQDFSSSDYTSQGVYVKYRMKFDQYTAGSIWEMKRWSLRVVLLQPAYQAFDTDGIRYSCGRCISGTTVTEIELKATERPRFVSPCDLYGDDSLHEQVTTLRAGS